MTIAGFALLLFLAAEPPAAPPALDAPKTFQGVLPCADCEGIRMTVNLHPDRSFVLREEYLGKNRSSIDLGRWSAAGEGRLRLDGGREGPSLFRVVDGETLRKLDTKGQEIVSSLNYDLKREPEYRLIEDPFQMSGRFTYLADAARMTICLTGQSLPVAQAEGYLALEKDYATKRSAPGEPLLVSFTGRFSERPRMDGAGKEVALVVEAYERAFPGESCPPLPGEAKGPAGKTPEGRYWKLVTLNGQPVSGGVGRKALELTLVAGSKRVQGATGCNRLMGRYALERDALRFSDLATSRMSCPDGAERERAFLQALGDVTGWRLEGEKLLLLARKVVVAEFVEKED